jgi:hypothetical protein
VVVHSSSPNQALVAPREARNCGRESTSHAMGCCSPVGTSKKLKSPRLKASPAGQEGHPRAPPAMGVRSWRARGGRPRDRVPQRRLVVDERISLKAVTRGTPTVASGRQAAVRQASGRAGRTPPGSQSGACMHRGRSGTGESHVSPWHTPGVGDRVTQGPGVIWGLRPEHAPGRDSPNAQKRARDQGASTQRSDLRWAAWQSERSIGPGPVGH